MHQPHLSCLIDTQNSGPSPITSRNPFSRSSRTARRCQNKSRKVKEIGIDFFPGPLFLASRPHRSSASPRLVRTRPLLPKSSAPQPLRRLRRLAPMKKSLLRNSAKARSHSVFSPPRSALSWRRATPRRLPRSSPLRVSSSSPANPRPSIRRPKARTSPR